MGNGLQRSEKEELQPSQEFALSLSRTSSRVQYSRVGLAVVTQSSYISPEHARYSALPVNSFRFSVRLRFVPSLCLYSASCPLPSFSGLAMPVILRSLLHAIPSFNQILMAVPRVEAMEHPSLDLAGFPVSMTLILTRTTRTTI